MPFSPRLDSTTTSSSGAVTSRASPSPQRRLPPLKQQLLQQSNHLYYPTQQTTSSGTYSNSTTTPPSHNPQHLNDNNNNKNGRPGNQYSKSFRFSNASPYRITNSIAYLGVAASTKTTPSSSMTSQARTPPSEAIRKRVPKARQHLFQVPMVRSRSQHGGTQLKVTDLNQDVVSQYLKQNPEVLDHHVTTFVSNDRVKKWLQLKSGTPPRSSTSRLQIATTNGEGNADKNLTLTRWKNKMQTSKGKLLQDLSRDFHHANSKVTVLLELAECVCAALSADVYTVYSCDSEKQELTHISKGEHGDVIYGAKERVGLGTSVSAAVAFSKEPTRLKDLLEGKRHPDRLTVSDSKAHCVLALPLVDDGDSCFGVVEFYRQSKNSQFTEEEEEMTIHMLQWYDLLVDYVETHSTMIRQRTLSDFLLEVTKSIFQDIVSMDIVIIKIMNFAQRLVHADRASLFLVDNCKRELYARIFDIGVASKAFLEKCSFQSKEVSPLPSNDSFHQEIRFSSC